jgi:hypothetical protein
VTEGCCHALSSTPSRDEFDDLLPLQILVDLREEYETAAAKTDGRNV